MIALTAFIALIAAAFAGLAIVVALSPILAAAEMLRRGFEAVAAVV